VRRRKNPDKRERELERAAFRGDLNAAFQLYQMRRRQYGPRGHDSPFVSAGAGGEVVWTTSKGDRMVIRPVTERAIYVVADRNTNRDGLTEPWVVNRVPIFWTVHFFYDPGGFGYGWIPFNDDFNGQLKQYMTPHWTGDVHQPPSREEVAGRIKELVEGHGRRKGPSIYYSTLYAYRADRFQGDPSQSAKGKLLAKVTKEVELWAKGAAPSMNTAGLVSVNERIASTEGEVQKLEQQLYQLHQQLGELTVEELRLQKGPPQTNPWW